MNNLLYVSVLTRCCVSYDREINYFIVNATDKQPYL